MKKYSLSILLQFLISTIVLMAGANTLSAELDRTKDELGEEKDVEMETNQERDAFPDLITFATHLYK